MEPTTMFEDGPEFESGQRVRITHGFYEGIEGVVKTYAQGIYYVEIDARESLYIAALPEFLEPAGDRVDPLKAGMTSEDLAGYVEQFIHESQARVRGVGDEQYSQGTHQRFEAMDVDDLFAWAQEEVQDIAVYAAMLDVRLRRIRNALKPHL